MKETNWCDKMHGGLHLGRIFSYINCGERSESIPFDENNVRFLIK
jgi:hypothetical protein